MINREQINAFHMIATCAYAAKGEELYELEKICDPCAPALFDKLWMVRGWLNAICGYDPASPYCLDDTQILNIIEATKKALCLCGDVNSLPEVALCIPCIQSGTPELEINELTWSCIENTEGANACYTITVVNGSGDYEFIIYINNVEQLRIAIPYTGGTGTYSACIFASGSPNQTVNAEVALHDIGKDALSDRVDFIVTNCGGGGGSGSGSGSGSGTPPSEAIVLGDIEFACIVGVPGKEHSATLSFKVEITDGSKTYVVEYFNGLTWVIVSSFATATSSGNFSESVSFIPTVNGIRNYRVRDVNTGITSNSVAVETTQCPYVENITIDSMSYACTGSAGGNLVSVNYTVNNGSGSYNLEYFNPDTLLWTNVLSFAGPVTGISSASNGFGRNDGGTYNFRLHDPNKHLFSNVFNLPTSICP